MVLRLIPLALLLAAAPLAAQVPARAPTKTAVRRTTSTTTGSYGWLGFRQDVQRDTLVVLEVAADSPAERAGLKRGDRITLIDGRPATLQLLGENPPAVGDLRRLTVRRGSETLTFSMVAVAPPAGALMPTRAAVANVDTIARDARDLRNRMALKATQAPTRSVTIDSLGNAVIAFTTSERQRLVGDSVLMRMDTLSMRIDTLLLDAYPTSLTGRLIADSTLYVQLRQSLESVDRVATKLALYSNAISGAEFEQLNPGLADYFGGVADGVFVLRVTESTPAATAGLRPGDVVQSVNGQHVSTVAEMRDAVAGTSGTITLHVLRKGKPATIVLRKD